MATGRLKINEFYFWHKTTAILYFHCVISLNLPNELVETFKFTDVLYDLKLSEALAYGSLISAVDPVATIAIFNAMKVDPVLNMLVFGESILNDAVAIVLSNLFQKASTWDGTSQESMIIKVFHQFFHMMVLSALLGAVFAVISALVLKHVNLRRTPSLEMGMMLVFCYVPYGLAEAVELSGIMALLFSGIVASHYTHQNLSLVTQINLQHTLRTLAFLAETSVFAYTGMAMFSFEHHFEPSFCFGSIILILVGRAANIFPLSAIVNKFRVVKINKRMQFVMWFSGLRGAIAYVLSLHMELENSEKRHIVITGTLVTVIFTIVVLGGLTYPLITFLKVTGPTPVRREKLKPKEFNPDMLPVTLSKSEHASHPLETDYASFSSSSGSESEDDQDIRQEIMKLQTGMSTKTGIGHPDDNVSTGGVQSGHETVSLAHKQPGQPAPSVKRVRRRKRPIGLRKDTEVSTHKSLTGALVRIDTQIITPFLCRRVTREELIANRTQMRQFATKWYDENLLQMRRQNR